MPMTIGTLTSNVNVVDGSNMPAEEMMEQIIQRVMARLKEEMYAAEQRRQEMEIRDRMTEPELF